jgi:predicted alpha/beta-hydrolase family hydrolase
LITDAIANWYVSYCLLQGSAASRVAQAVISGLALCSLLIARQARPWMRQRRSKESRPPP